jgi:TDG/mug DNA glycosylase family protein
VIAFTSKKAASLFYGRPTREIMLGLQPPRDGLGATFVLASPSGAASGAWTLQPWLELAAHVKA